MVSASLTGLFCLHYTSLHPWNHLSCASSDPEACIAGYPEGSRYAHDSQPQSVQIATAQAAILTITRWCLTWFSKVSHSILPYLLFLARSVLSSLANELTFKLLLEELSMLNAVHSTIPDSVEFSQGPRRVKVDSSFQIVSINRTEPTTNPPNFTNP